MPAAWEYRPARRPGLPGLALWLPLCKPQFPLLQNGQEQRRHAGVGGSELLSAERPASAWRLTGSSVGAGSWCPPHVWDADGNFKVTLVWR